MSDETFSKASQMEADLVHSVVSPLQMVVVVQVVSSDAGKPRAREQKQRKRTTQQTCVAVQ